ncbi:radical SAM/SPASM domain-containing protein [Methanoregula sp.]|uniref:radical SAM/SPASM domain-containing protein n=1 Tax=Methanoregula sp. TaxID=2052170 RepID=UPI003C72CC7E
MNSEKTGIIYKFKKIVLDLYLRIRKKPTFENLYQTNLEQPKNRLLLKATADDMKTAAEELAAIKIENVDEINIFQYTNRVSIELSNLCNYSTFHKKCPLSFEVDTRILPAKIVISVLDILHKYHFKGMIAFHTFNEPLIDPRLFKFIEYAKKSCPDSTIYFSTNGFYLDQNLADELVECGLTRLHISVYSPKEYERLSKIKLPIRIDLEKMILLNIIPELYQSPILNEKTPCQAPLGEIIVTRDGQISLCCRDWQRRYILGDLNEETLEEILKRGNLQAIHSHLSKGNRLFNICQRCNWSR